MSRIALFLILALVAGCARMHGLDGLPADGGMVDAGMDAGSVMMDAATLPPPPYVCATEPIDPATACSEQDYRVASPCGDRRVVFSFGKCNYAEGAECASDAETAAFSTLQECAAACAAAGHCSFGASTSTRIEDYPVGFPCDQFVLHDSLRYSVDLETLSCMLGPWWESDPVVFIPADWLAYIPRSDIWTQEMLDNICMVSLMGITSVSCFIAI